MIYLEGLMHKKINIFIAILVIAIIVSLAAWAITAQALLGGRDISLRVLSNRPVKCVTDPSASTCFHSCPICGDISNCSSLWEVQVKRLSGGLGVLRKNIALCLINPIPPNSGQFKNGVRCVGKVKVMGNGPHLLYNFSCSQR